jgi:xanthine dehydrogenase accessory factor
MKELQTILNAFKQSQRLGQRSAIATVIKTSGSVYRRPGARMLLTESGEMIGAISGGCLESDVFEQAKPVLLQESTPIVVQYDTTAQDDVVWGLGMGCNGTVQVLIESLNDTSAMRQLSFIADCFQQNQSGAIATVFQVIGKTQTRIAARLCLKTDGTVINEITDQRLANQILRDANQQLAKGKSLVKSYSLDDGLAEVFIEIVQPPVQLLVFGAGYDAIPVVQFAKQLGWQVTVIDPRSTYATPDRFPQADTLIVCQPNRLQDHLTLNSQMVAVVMTHHYLHDRTLLQTLLPASLRYLGVLGPKRRTQQLLADLQAEGCKTNQRLHSPIGLDIGAETPEEIALAIVAEIQAVLSRRSGQFLHDRPGAIHDELSILHATEPTISR